MRGRLDDIAVGASTKLFTYPELCAALSVSRSYLEEKVRTGQLVATRLGRTVRFHPADVAAFIDRHRAVPRTLDRRAAPQLTPVEQARAARAMNRRPS